MRADPAVVVHADVPVIATLHALVQHLVVRDVLADVECVLAEVDAAVSKRVVDGAIRPQQDVYRLPAQRGERALQVLLPPATGYDADANSRLRSARMDGYCAKFKQTGTSIAGRDS